MTHVTLVSHKPLNKQAQRVRDYMIQTGGISRREAMDLGILNLPARILDIRMAFGPESVLTDMVAPNGGTEYAVWRWRGSIEPQADLFA